MIALISALTAANAAGLRTGAFKTAALEKFDATDNYAVAKNEFVNSTVEIFDDKKTALVGIKAELENSKNAVKTAMLEAKAVEERAKAIKKQAVLDEKAAKDVLVQAKKTAIRTKFADERAIKQGIAETLKAQKEAEKNFKLGIAAQKMAIMDDFKAAVEQIKDEEKVAMREIQRGIIMNKGESDRADEQLKDEFVRINKAKAFEIAQIAKETEASLLALKSEETAAKLALKLSFDEKYSAVEEGKLQMIATVETAKADSKALMREKINVIKTAVSNEKQNLMNGMAAMKITFQEKMAKLALAKAAKDEALAALAMGPQPQTE